MFRFYFNKKITVGFVLALAILSWLSFYSYVHTQELISSSHLVAHTHDVLYNAERILAIAMNIEIGQRGYALTGHDEFLEPYKKAKSEIDRHVKNLFDLTKDNANQQQHIKKLAYDIDKLLVFSSTAVAARRSSFEEALHMNATRQGKRLMDLIRNSISEIQIEENKLLRTRIANNEAQIVKFNKGFMGILLFTGLVLILLFFSVNLTLKARYEAEDRLSKASGEIQDLYDNAPCGYHSIDHEGVFVNINSTLMKWLGYQHKSEVVGKLKFTDIIPDEEIDIFQERYDRFKQKGSIHDVEFNFKRKNGTVFPVILSSVAIYDDDGRFIKSRSNSFDNTERKITEIQIKNLNHELEAFSYSVSHDLRAPLRSIDGYTRILWEDYWDRVDDEGKRVIQVIVNNAKRMSQLIDDLLDFSRVGKKEISWVPIDMTSLVENIATELIANEPDRKISLKVHPLEPSAGDVDMIRQVWVNLISNAIKYTGKTEQPQIEISSAHREQEICYKIQDNGVGFDMQYVNKLFGVFQRLHKMQEFSGTGVGLAIVKRIISRHGGTVWAEGWLNKGAIFYFTIPNGKQ